MSPPLSTLLSFVTHEDEQGAMFGVKNSLGAFGRFCGPLMAGVLFADVGSEAPYVAAGALMLISLVIFLTFRAPKEATVG